jgi:hypothetical protein
VNANAADGVKALQHPAVNGGGSLAVELLIDNRLGQRFKRRLRSGELQCERAGALDQLTQLCIGGCKLAAGEVNIVWRLAISAGGGTWHEHQRTAEKRVSAITMCANRQAKWPDQIFLLTMLIRIRQ